MSFRKTLILLLSALLFSIAAHAETKVAVDTVVVIVEEVGPVHAHPPKAPAIVPIDCLLSASLSALVVDFHFNLGFLFVEIENLTTGEYSSSPVNALPGPMIFPISGTAGFWRILFTLSSGVRYSGEFII